MTEAEQWEHAYEQLTKWEEEVANSNETLLIRYNVPDSAMLLLMEDCEYSHHEKIEIVDVPAGEDQTSYENNPYFDEIWVDQWSVGMSGDSYEGHIYAKLENDVWLKVPFYV